MPTKSRSLIAWLDTPAGHILVCFALLVIGAVFALAGLPKAEDIIVISLGILGRSMIGRNPPPDAPAT
jgi:hypothetical protein